MEHAHPARHRLPGGGHRDPLEQVVSALSRPEVFDAVFGGMVARNVYVCSPGIRLLPAVEAFSEEGLDKILSLHLRNHFGGNGSGPGSIRQPEGDVLELAELTGGFAEGGSVLSPSGRLAVLNRTLDNAIDDVSEMVTTVGARSVPSRASELQEGVRVCAEAARTVVDTARAVILRVEPRDGLIRWSLAHLAPTESTCRVPRRLDLRPASRGGWSSGTPSVLCCGHDRWR